LPRADYECSTIALDNIQFQNFTIEKVTHQNNKRSTEVQKHFTVDAVSLHTRAQM
jgi:hypothetical protein